MLEAIRKRSASLVVKLLFLLLVLSFGLWGIADVFSPGRQENWAAEVGGVVIPMQSLNEAYQNELRRLRPLLGATVDAEQARALGLPERALSQVISRMLLDLDAADLGITVSDDLIRQTIQANPAFQNQQGQFDKAIFDQVLRNNGLSEPVYVSAVRDDGIRGQLVTSLTAARAVSKAMAEALYLHSSERRVAEFIRIKDSAATDLPKPNETELREFHKENAGPFTAPEYRKVTAILVSAKDLANEISISDQQLETAYEERADEFKVVERRQLEQILFDNEEAARSAHDRLAKGDAFAVVAKEEADLEAEDLKLGFLAREELLPELAEVAFNLSEGDISEPLKSPLGWHVIKVLEIQPAQQQSFEQVREQIKAQMAADEALDVLFELTNRLEDTLGRGATLEEAASELDLKLIKIASVDQNGLDANGARVNGLPEGFINAVFSTDEGTESQLTETGADGFFIVRTDEITPSTLKPFETVREKVLEAWTQSKRTEATKKTADEFVDQVAKGAELQQIAAENDLNVVMTPPFDRSGDRIDQQIPKSLVDMSFRTSLGKPFVVRDQSAWLIGRVKGVINAAPDNEETEVANFSKDLESMVSNDLLIQLTSALRKRYPVEVNQQAIEQLY
jgi:peptidyl-prolyl cis-trans isomerase D